MRYWWLVAVPLALPPCAALGADPAPQPVPASALQACAALVTESERLACYDKLAGRAPAAPVSAPAVSASPSAKAVAPAAAPAAPTAPVPAPPAAAPDAGAASSSGAAARAAGTSPASPQTFGLYSAEHPKAVPGSKSESLKIVDMVHSPYGYPLVYLEGGQLWELHDGDPLLATGDTVTIRRAALGSFLLQTPSGRTLRARRLR